MVTVSVAAMVVSSTRPLFGDFNPVPTTDFALFKTDRTVDGIAILELGADSGTEFVSAAMTAATLRALSDGPHHTHFVTEIDNKASDVLHPPAGIRLYDR